MERVYDHVESGDVDKAVFACLRLARKIGDTFNAIMFLRELNADKEQFADQFFHETEKLNKEARSFLWERTAKRWIAERTVRSPGDGNSDESKVLDMGVGDLSREVDQLEKAIQDMALPEGMGAYDVAAFTDQLSVPKALLRHKIHMCNTVVERIRARCLDYATRTERVLKTAADATGYLGELQVEVNSYYAERCPDAYAKLIKAGSLIGSSDTEDHALLLATIRRAVHVIADYHFPPKETPYLCLDGKERHLGAEQYLNRLQEFCRSIGGDGSSNSLFLAEMDYLAAFVRRLHESASKGVHAEVTSAEAKQGLLGLYMFLANLIAKLESSEGEASKSSD